VSQENNEIQCDLLLCIILNGMCDSVSQENN